MNIEEVEVTVEQIESSIYLIRGEMICGTSYNPFVKKKSKKFNHD